MTNYSEAMSVLNGRTSRKIGNNTYVIAHEGFESIAVRLHNTDVVTYYRDGSVQLRTGGWWSKTTKDRINQWSLAGLYQRNFDWFYSNGAKFQDGDTILADGTIQTLQQKYDLERADIDWDRAPIINARYDCLV